MAKKLNIKENNRGTNYLTKKDWNKVEGQTLFFFFHLVICSQLFIILFFFFVSQQDIFIVRKFLSSNWYRKRLERSALFCGIKETEK